MSCQPILIKLGKEKKIYLGNLDAKRDWGYAKDYVEGMWRILQHEVPGDWVLATGEATSVRKFVEITFEKLERKITWDGLKNVIIGRENGCLKFLHRVYLIIILLIHIIF